jgi:hypothetical protein
MNLIKKIVNDAIWDWVMEWCDACRIENQKCDVRKYDVRKQVVSVALNASLYNK